MIKKIRSDEFRLFQTIDELLKRGIKEKIIKDYPLPVLTSFAYIPIITLLNFHHAGIIEMDEDNIMRACEIAWNAIHS